MVFAEAATAGHRDVGVERERLPADVEIATFAWSGDDDRLVAALADADAVLTDYVPFTRDILARLPKLRFISVAATGFDCVDIEAAAAAGVSVACASEYCSAEVADHTLALMLALTRRLRDYDRQVQQRHSWAWDEVRGSRALDGQALGLVGCGRIGRAVGHRARGFGLRVLACDPALDPAVAKTDGLTPASFEEVLSQSDIISVHCALLPETAGMFDAPVFAAMRRRPLFINVARGGLVVEAALVRALDHGQVAGAALDVLAEDDPDLATHPLRGRADVLLTPHVAFYSEDALRKIRRISADNIRWFLEGKRERIDRLVV